jgi:hypothetical protein
MANVRVWGGSAWLAFTGAAPIVPASGRDSLVSETYYPSASTVGVLPDVARTTYGSTTSVTFSTPGQTVENLRFECEVSVAAADVTFKNCYFAGKAVVDAGTSRGLVNATNASVLRAKFIDCTFNPQTPSPGVTGVQGHDFHVLRCEITRVNDGVDFFGDNCIVEASWIHHLGYFSPSFTNSNNATHNDDCQIHGGAHHQIIGNNFEGNYAHDVGQVYAGSYQVMADVLAEVDGSGNNIYGNKYYDALLTDQTATSAIMFNQITSVPYDVTIRGNLLGGGANTINMNVDTNPSGGIGSVTNNVFRRNSRADIAFARAIGLASGLTVSNNTYQDDGSAIVVRNA